jgi:lipoic acid synthetase
MLGLGETESEIRQALSDLRQVNVDVITFGQYLQPSLKHLPVHAYLTPEMFDTWKQVAEQEFNFLYCASGPLVRSSYKAGELLMEALVTKQKMTIR